MPELPEVTTTTNGLKKVLPKLSIVDMWTDLVPSLKQWKTKNRKNLFKNTLKDPIFYKKFKKSIINTRVTEVERRAKNILIHLNNNQTILIHLRMTGHLLFGKYIFTKNNKWIPCKSENKALFDPYNRFIHVVFSLSNKKHLVFCDARKFGKITLIPTDNLYNKKYELYKLGPEPLDKKFLLKNFKERLLLKKNGKIKTVLMDQSIIAGIGNIYSDETLWLSNIHPESKPINIPDLNLKLLYKSIVKLLKKGISLGGDSTSDYRNIYGEKGNFHKKHNVYQRKNEQCIKIGCKGVIIKKVINGRSAHFCNIHQKLF